MSVPGSFSWMKVKNNFSSEETKNKYTFFQLYLRGSDTASHCNSHSSHRSKTRVHPSYTFWIQRKIRRYSDCLALLPASAGSLPVNKNKKQQQKKRNIVNIYKKTGLNDLGFKLNVKSRTQLTNRGSITPCIPSGRVRNVKSNPGFSMSTVKKIIEIIHLSTLKCKF